MPKFVVLGAGPGGLTAAMLLAAQGAEVEIFEQQQNVGGRSAALSGQGFRFDRGATFFLYPQILAEIFAHCGYELQREIELIRLDPQYQLVFENAGVLKATPDVKRMQQALAAFSAADANNLPQFLAENRSKLKQFEPILQQSFMRYRDLLKLFKFSLLKHMRPWNSVDAELGRYFQDPRIRLAFGFQSKYLGMSPFQCPGLFTILSYMEYAHGVFHPVGGCSAVLDKMAELAKAMGVKIHLGEPVQQLQLQGRKVTGVFTQSGLHRCDGLIANADFGHWVNNLLPADTLRRWHPKKLQRKQYSCSTFMLYLGIKGEYEQLEHHNIFLSDNYLDNMKMIASGKEPPQNPSLYIQNAVKTDPTLAPAGHSTLYVLVPVANQQNGYAWTEQQSQYYRQQVMQRLAKFGLPDLASRIVFERMVTPQTWQQDLSVHLGATFNLAHSLRQMLIWRPHNRFEDLDGVYLVGGATHPGSGLPVIFEGARITCNLIAEDFGLPALQQQPRRDDKPFTNFQLDDGVL